MKGLSWREVLGAAVVAILAWLLAVLILVSCPEQAAGAEAEPETGSAVPPVAASPAVMPAPGEVREVEPGHWLAHLSDEKFIDLFAPEGAGREWNIIGPDREPQTVQERPEPGAPEGIRRFQVGFKYLDADGGKIRCLVTGTIVDTERGGPVRIIDLLRIPEQPMRIVYRRVKIPGPERVVTKKKKNTTAIVLGALGLGAGIWALTSDGSGTEKVPVTDMPRKYCPYWRQHVVDDHAAGKNTDREHYTYWGATWTEVDRKLTEHLRNCPYAQASPGSTGDSDQPWDPQGGGPGVGDSFIAPVRGTTVIGLSLSDQTRLVASGASELALVHQEGDLALFLASDGRYGFKADRFALELAPRAREIAAAAKIGSGKIRWSSIEGRLAWWFAVGGNF